MSAEYWIAQHVGDPFRNEPRNVGVFVRYDEKIVAKFFGEDDQGIVDGRRIRAFEFPDVYRQWLTYWRTEAGFGGIDSIVRASTTNFRVLPGGEVSGIGGDKAADVANYLYSLLVSEGGFQEAIALNEQTAAAAIQLSAEVTDALAAAQLLLRDERAEQRVPHPVRRNAQVIGTIATYRPAFTQENGRLYVMETIDFTKFTKKTARDHAGWSAYMFHDLRSTIAASEPISIVRVNDEDHDLEEVRTGLAVLRNESTLVDWSDATQRGDFLEERRRIALG